MLEFCKATRRKYGPVAAAGFLFSLLLYAPLYTQQLTNTYDGFWKQNYCLSGSWEVSLGRWGLVYADALTRGAHIDPVTTLLTLGAYVLGFTLILALLEAKGRLFPFLALALFLSSTAVSVTLSYRMTSLAYGLAFLFSVCSAACLARLPKTAAALGGGAVFLCLFMALYQAYLATFALTALFCLLRLCRDRTPKELGRYVGRVAAGAGLGMALYYALVLLHLRLYGTSLNGYHGAGSAGPLNTLLHLPQRLDVTYRSFWGYFVGPAFRLNTLQELGLLRLLLAAAGLALLLLGLQVFRQNRRALPFFALGCLLLPPACNAALLLATEAEVQLQMTAAPALFAPLVLVLAAPALSRRRALAAAGAALGLLILYGSSLQVLLDQNAMEEGRRGVETMGLAVLQDLREQNLLTPEQDLVFIGRPADNAAFYGSELYAQANSYAQVGAFWLDGNSMFQSYRALFERILGARMRISAPAYDALVYTEAVAAMPAFPEEGYIQRQGEVVVVKISSSYP